MMQALKKEIRKEMKIKEGAEKLREVSTDKKSLSNVNSIVKKANTKLQQLHQDLQEVNTFLLLTNSTQDISTGERTCYTPVCGNYKSNLLLNLLKQTLVTS